MIFIVSICISANSLIFIIEIQKMKTIICESISNFSPYVRIISYKFYEDTDLVVKKYKYVNIDYNPDKGKDCEINND